MPFHNNTLILSCAQGSGNKALFLSELLFSVCRSAGPFMHPGIRSHLYHWRSSLPAPLRGSGSVLNSTALIRLYSGRVRFAR